MARLQDFSNVTPSSSSDKLLIVQSAGQGLATLDTAGQQIANNTSVSQLHTTSKTLAGAINEHDSEIGSLSQLTTSVKSSLVGAVNEATSAERLYINTTYQNDVGSNITLSKSIKNFRFLRVTVSIGTNDNYNKCHILIPNMKTYLSGVYPLATISGGDKWVRIEMYTPNDTKIYIISSSEASLCIYEVVGVN